MTERKKEYDAEYRAKHKDMLNHKKRMWYKENRERVLAEQKQYRVRKRERMDMAATNNKFCKTCLLWYDKKCYGNPVYKKPIGDDLAKLYVCSNYIPFNKKIKEDGNDCLGS